jgi:hypothetical protein
MTVTEAIAATYLLATGKATAPSSGTAKYTKILALLNIFTQNWATEPVMWASLRSTFTVTSPATVTATDTFAIPATVGKISEQEGDYVRINHANGTDQSTYTIVPIERLYDDGPTINNAGGPYCAVSGSNLIFPVAFTSTSPQFGGTVKIPGYAIPATLTDGADVIQVDDPYWLCYMAAAEYIRNDITRVQQYGNLIAQANNSMNNMINANNSQKETAYASWSPGNGTGGETWS